MSLFSFKSHTILVIKCTVLQGKEKNDNSLPNYPKVSQKLKPFNVSNINCLLKIKAWLLVNDNEAIPPPKFAHNTFCR